MDKTFTEAPSILKESETFWLLDKPSGWLVHPQRGVDAPALTDWVMENLGQEQAFPVHRLDRGTSGLMLWAKNSESARSWQALWQAGRVRKGYVALVRGRFAGERFLDHPVPADEKAERKPAQSYLSALESVEAIPRALSLLEVEPYTGRYHQIRRHVKHLGHPLIGDSNYGRTELNRAFRASVGLARLGLHAAWLQLPAAQVDDDPITYFSHLPASLYEPLVRLGFSEAALDIKRLRLFLKPRAALLR